MRAASILAVTVGLVGHAMADFYIYYGIQYATVEPSNTSGFLFLAGPPDCNNVYNTVVRTETDDASGGGVRCEGCSTAEDNNVQVTELEFNDDDYGHYTWYKDREGAPLVDVNGAVAGTCNIDNSDSYDCFDGLATYKGQSQIHCISSLPIP